MVTTLCISAILGIVSMIAALYGMLTYLPKSRRIDQEFVRDLFAFWTICSFALGIVLGIGGVQ